MINNPIGNSFTTFILEFAKKQSGKITDNIMDESIEGLGKIINDLISDFTVVINSCIENLGLTPSLTQWNAYLGTSLTNQITTGCQIFGASVAFLLLLYYIIQYLMNPEKQRVTPLQTFARLTVAALFIVYAETARTQLLVLMTRIYALVLSVDNRVINIGDLIIIKGSGDGGAIGNPTVFGVTLAACAIPPLSLLIPLIAFILSWQLIKQYFRCLLELIERYLILMLILMFMPAAAGTMVHEGTENIFKSYWRMVFGQSFLLIFGGVMLRGATSLVIGKVCSVDLMGYIFVLGYLKTIQRVDSYLQSMGLNVANSIGGMAQSFLGAGMCLAAGLRGLNNARKGVGGAAAALGLAANKEKLFKAGSVLGTSANDISRNGLPTHDNLEKQFASRMSSSGSGGADMSSEASAKLLSNYMSSPRDYAGAVGGMSGASLNNGMQSLTGMDNVQNTNLGRNGDIDFTFGEENTPATLSLADDGLSRRLVNEDGELIGFMNTQNSLANGDTITGSLEELTQQTGAMGLGEHTDLSPNVLNSINTATSENGITTFASDGNAILQTDRGNNVFAPVSGFGNQRLDSAMGSELVGTAEKMYPGWKSVSNTVDYDAKNNAHYITMQKSGNSSKHRLYIQDSVSKNTYLPSKEDSMERKAVKINQGPRHKGRLLMGFKKEPVRTQKE